MKKIFLLFLAMPVILCSCSKKDSSENISNTSVCETSESSEEQVLTGIPEEYIEYGFSPQVNKKDLSLQLFCCDGNGNVYFSDPADNFCLYSYDGSESKKLTDIKAYGLNYYNNKVYFLSPQKGINIDDMIYPEGYAYEYDIQSGKTTQIGDSEICDMTVIDGEIFGMNTDNAAFFYKYDENNPDCRNKKVFNSFVIKKCKDHFFTFETVSENNEDKINFYLQNGNDKQLLLADDIPLDCFFAFGKFYYFSQNTHELKIIDMENGEISSPGFAKDFTVLDGELYILKSDQYLYKAGNENKLNELNQFEYIFSDNKNLYGVAFQYNSSSKTSYYVFVKINSDFSIETIGSKGE